MALRLAGIFACCGYRGRDGLFCPLMAITQQ
jgi:hypothetical protein